MSLDLLNRARDLMASGRADQARAELEAALKDGQADADVHTMLGYASYHSNRMDEALRGLEAAAKTYPADPLLQEALARMRWMSGAGDRFADEFLAAVNANQANLALRLKCADLLRLAGMPESAERLLREALAATPDDISVQAWLAVLLDETGRFEEAERMLRAALRFYPIEPALRLNLGHVLMRQGRSEQALESITMVRRAYPDNQLAITYEATALRQAGDSKYKWLCNYDRHLRVYDLDPPPGYASIAAFNTALAEVLRKMHVAPDHPLDQSLRGGSQTSGDLTLRGDPVVLAYFDALAKPVSDYIGKLGGDPKHPLESRRTGQFNFSGCWSVLLRPGGFHVNHTHPNGWISSSYYVSLPASVSDANEEGWIKFGEPRWPIPGCGIERKIQPKEGRLVLFPSYMWHGTIPFSSGERLTAPFDVVPGGGR